MIMCNSLEYYVPLRALFSVNLIFGWSYSGISAFVRQHMFFILLKLHVQ